MLLGTNKRVDVKAVLNYSDEKGAISTRTEIKEDIQTILDTLIALPIVLVKNAGGDCEKAEISFLKGSKLL